MALAIGLAVIVLAMIGLARLCTLSWRAVGHVARGVRLSVAMSRRDRPVAPRAPQRPARRERERAPDAGETTMWCPSDVGVES